MNYAEVRERAQAVVREARKAYEFSPGSYTFAALSSAIDLLNVTIDIINDDALAAQITESFPA